MNEVNERWTRHVARRGIRAMIAVLLLLAAGAAAAHAYDRTWNYSGSFKASLSTSSFQNHKVGTIKITVDAGNCTVDSPLPEYRYPYIYFQLEKQGTLVFGPIGSKRTVYCSGGVYTFTYANAAKGTYRMVFTRSGPTGMDENYKTVNGVVSYW